MKILCAVDESEVSLWAMESVGKLFRHSVTELILLHVVELGLLKGGSQALHQRFGQNIGRAKKF